MVTNLREEDRPEPWHKKRTHVPTYDRETRTAGRTVARNDAVQEKKASNLPSGSRQKRRNFKGKGVETAKGMKKTKPVPATTINVLLGRGDNPVRSVEELNKKTEEDARACGRIPKNVLNPDALKSCPTTTSISSDGVEIGRKSPPAMPLQVPSASPNLLPVDVATGKTLNH